MLSDMQFETKTIGFRGQEFTVRGLGLDIISKLLRSSSRADLDAAIGELQKGYEANENDDSVEMESSMISFITRMPALAASVIAICADEPDAAPIVEKLPLPVQTEALISIFYLTFDGEESLKNFVSGLKALMQSLTKAVAAAQEAGQIAGTGSKA